MDKYLTINECEFEFETTNAFEFEFDTQLCQYWSCWSHLLWLLCIETQSYSVIIVFVHSAVHDIHTCQMLVIINEDRQYEG